MTYCPLRYDGYKNFQEARRMEEQTIVVCQSRPFPQILKEAEKLDMTMEYERLGGELEDRMFLIHILPRSPLLTSELQSPLPRNSSMSFGKVLQWIKSHFCSLAIPNILNLCLQRKNLMFSQHIISETMLQNLFLVQNPSHPRCTLSYPWNRWSSILFSQKILKLVVFVSLSYLWQHLSFLSKKKIACFNQSKTTVYFTPQLSRTNIHFHSFQNFFLNFEESNTLQS